MADKNTIKNWFRTGLEPTQAQFWATWDSFWHKSEKIPITAIDDIENILNAKAETEVLTDHLTTPTAHADLFGAKEDKTNKGSANGYAPLDAFIKLSSQYLNIVNDLVTGGASSLLSAEQGKLLQTQINNINILLASDNVNLDNVQELVDAIETVQASLSTILVNDLTTGGTTKALTAEMGKSLKALINVKEDASNKSTDVETNKTSNIKYPSIKAVVDWVTGNFFKKGETITTIAGTATVAPLIMPNGTLNTTPVNGAIERDINGVFYITHSGTRFPIITGDGNNAFFMKFSNTKGKAVSSFLQESGSILEYIGNFNINGGSGDGSTYTPRLRIYKTSSSGNVLSSRIVQIDNASNWGNLHFQVKSVVSSEENESYYLTAIEIKGNNGNVLIGKSNDDGSRLQLGGRMSEVVQEFAGNSAALSAGLGVGAHYRTGEILKIVY